MKQIHVPQAWTYSLVRPKHGRDMRFCTWNVKCLYRSGSLTTVDRELGKNKLSLLCVEEGFAGTNREL